MFVPGSGFMNERTYVNIGGYFFKAFTISEITQEIQTMFIVGTRLILII